MTRRLLPSVYEVGDEVKAMKGKNPQLASQYDSLELALEQNLGSSPLTALSLERNLRTDAVFRQQVKDLAIKDPAKLEKILPEALKSPDQMKRIVAEASKGLSSAPQVEADPAGQAQETAVPKKKPEPVAVAAAVPPPPRPPREKGVVEKIVDAVTPTAQAATLPAARANEGTALDRMDGKATKPNDQLLQLGAMSGFSEFADKVNKNTHLKEAIGRALADGGSEQSKEIIGTLYEQAQDDPQFFAKLNKTIDSTPPNLMSTFARQIADNPKTGMMMFGMYNNMAGSGGIMGALMKIPAISELIANVLPAISALMDKIFGAMGSIGDFVKDKLSTSEDVFADGSPDLARKALNASGATPETKVTQAGGEPKTLEEQNRAVEESHRREQAARGMVQAAATPDVLGG